MVAGDVLLAVSMVVFGIVRDSARLDAGLDFPAPRPFLFSLPPWVIVSVHVMGGLLLLGRRQRPQLAAVSLALLAVIVPILSAGAMTYSAARYCRHVWVAVLLSAALVAGMLLGGNLFGLLGVFDWSRGDPYTVMLIGALLTAVGLYRRARADLRIAVQEQIRRAARDRDVAAELRRLRERAELAVDLHDAVARWLTLMTLGASTLASVENAEIRRTAADLRRYGARALEELHAMIGTLTVENEGDTGTGTGTGTNDGPAGGGVRDGGLPNGGLPNGGPANGNLANGRTGREGAGRLLALAEPDHRAPVSVHAAGLEQLDTRSMDLAGAIAAEAVLNARKYAPGAAVRVDARVSSDRLHLVVDNAAGGIPDPQTTGSGLGLRSLRDRCAAAGGRLRSGSRPDGGFRVDATVPLVTNPLDEVSAEAVSAEAVTDEGVTDEAVAADAGDAAADPVEPAEQDPVTPGTLP